MLKHKDIYVVMSMYILIECSNNYSKRSASLRQYYRDEPALNDDITIDDFSGNSVSFKFKQKIADETINSTTKNGAIEKFK